jgi:hypothetical protein
VDTIRLANEHDLALLSVPGLEIEPLIMRSSASLQIGERVFVVGAPRGLELSLAEGLVSSLREYEGGVAIQTSAPVSPGSSGGGLFDARGNLIGITTFGVLGENLNFALPAEWASELAQLAPPPANPEEARVAESAGSESAPAFPRVVVGSLDSSKPQTEEERARSKAEAVYRPRIAAVAGQVKELRIKTRRYYAACYNRKTVQVREGSSATTSSESGRGGYVGEASIYNRDGDYVGRTSSSGGFGWGSVRGQSSDWYEVSTLDNSTTTECRLLASDIGALLPVIGRAVEEAEQEAVKQGVWTWMQRDVPEKLVAELW